MLLPPRVLLLTVVLSSFGCRLAAWGQIETWLTSPDKSSLFEKQPELRFAVQTNDHPTIEVEDSSRFQPIDGFGYCLTGGSAQHLLRMSPPARAALLRELFAVDSTNIGVSYLRVSIGASDLNERVFSYDDLPRGETDPGLVKFSLGPDRAEVIPVLKEILALAPELKILGSPWSPPPWMKDNADTRGGALKPEFYPAYARYFVKYIQAMKQEGVRIDAITVQNEPLNPGNNPSLKMEAREQAEFIQHHLGPAFREAGLSTKIICYDHNADHPDYPLTILDNPQVAQYVDGSAFHLYRGTIDALSSVHQAHPEKNLYFTEQWVGAPGGLQGNLNWHVKQLIIGATRNWCRTVIEWNLSSDPAYQPHTDRGGCDRCLGAITVDGDKVTRNPAYYIIAHASKFVRPGSVRIASNFLEQLPNVAFRTPSGRHVLVVLNAGGATQAFNIREHGRSAAVELKSGAVATLVWQPT